MLWKVYLKKRKVLRLECNCYNGCRLDKFTFTVKSRTKNCCKFIVTLPFWGRFSNTELYYCIECSVWALLGKHSVFCYLFCGVQEIS